MGKSVSVRLEEVRAVFGLVAECCERGHDPVLWQMHLAEGIQRLLRSGLVLGGEFRTVNNRSVPVCAVDLGWATESARRLWLEWQSRPDLPDNPILEPFYSRTESNPTCVGDDLVATCDWEASPYFNEVMRPCELGDAVISCRAGADATESLVVVSRGLREARFGPHERALLGLLHDELAPHLGTRLATSTDPVARLSPRHRDVLRCLLEGDAEKQIALRLGIAVSTAHDHVKALYRHFGVGSRPQLSAYFLRRGWRLPS